MTINQRVKAIRKRYRMSQGVFADVLDVKQATISQVENEKIMPSLDMIINIVDNYNNIDIYWLLLGQGEMFIKGKPRPPKLENEVKEDGLEDSNLSIAMNKAQDTINRLVVENIELRHQLEAQQEKEENESIESDMVKSA